MGRRCPNSQNPRNCVDSPKSWFAVQSRFQQRLGMFPAWTSESPVSMNVTKLCVSNHVYGIFGSTELAEYRAGSGSSTASSGATTGQHPRRRSDT